MSLSFLSVFLQTLAIRLLCKVLPHRLDELDDRKHLLNKVFSIVGNTLLTYANDPAICGMGKKKEGISVTVTASHSNTVTEALIELGRTLHVLPAWNSLINDLLIDKLSLVPQLLTDLSHFQPQLEDVHLEGLITHTTGVVASLAMVGGVDNKPRMGGRVYIEEERIHGKKWILI